LGIREPVREELTGIMTMVFSLQYGIQEPPRCPAGAFAETPLPSYLRNPSRSSSARRALARYGPDGHGDTWPRVAMAIGATAG